MKKYPTTVSKQSTRYEWQALTKDPFGQTRFSVAAELFTCTHTNAKSKQYSIVSCRA